MDLPEIEPPQFLITAQAGGGGRIVKCPPWGRETAPRRCAEKVCRGSKKVFHLMILLQRVPDSQNRGLLPAKMGVAIKNLKNSQAPHNSEFIGGEPRRKGRVAGSNGLRIRVAGMENPAREI